MEIRRSVNACIFIFIWLLRFLAHSYAYINTNNGGNIQLLAIWLDFLLVSCLLSLVLFYVYRVAVIHFGKRVKLCGFFLHKKYFRFDGSMFVVSITNWLSVNIFRLTKASLIVNFLRTSSPWAPLYQISSPLHHFLSSPSNYLTSLPSHPHTDHQQHIENTLPIM